MPSPLANPFNMGQLSDFVSNATISWQKGAELAMEDALAVRSLFEERGADQRTEYFSNVSDSGFASKSGDGEDYQLITKTQGDTLTTVQIKRTARAKVTEDLLEFNKYPEVDSFLRDVGGFLWRGYALDLTHRFTFAFDTSYTDRDGETVATTGGDTAALCADTHTMNDGSTYDNKITSRLSESSLEDAEDLGAAMIDHNGQLVTVKFDTLITSMHAATKHMAMRLVGQDTQEGTDLRNMNVYRGKYSHIILPYLDTTALGAKNTSKSRYWFITSSAGKRNLKARVRKMPVLDAPSKDPDNNNMQFKAAMWYDIGHLDANWLVGAAAV